MGAESSHESKQSYTLRMSVANYDTKKIDIFNFTVDSLAAKVIAMYAECIANKGDSDQFPTLYIESTVGYVSYHVFDPAISSLFIKLFKKIVAVLKETKHVIMLGKVYFSANYADLETYKAVYTLFDEFFTDESYSSTVIVKKLEVADGELHHFTEYT